MIVKYYTIFDKIGVQSAPLWPAKNDGVAMRQFQMLQNREENKDMKKEDFKLYCVGNYDDETMTFSPETYLVEVNILMEVE